MSGRTVHTLIQERVRQRATGALQNLNAVQVGAALHISKISPPPIRSPTSSKKYETYTQAKHGINCHQSKVLAILSQNLGAESGAGNIKQILAQKL
jgi:hypothetical protein